MGVSNPDSTIRTNSMILVHYLNDYATGLMMHACAMTTNQFTWQHSLDTIVQGAKGVVR